MWQQCEELGLENPYDDDLAQFLSEFHITAAKLAGALHDVAEGHGHFEPAFIVAYLKRALDRLHKSQAGLEAVASKGCCRRM